MGFPGGSDCKESACNAEDLALIPGLGRSPGEGNGNPLQYSCLENPEGYSPWGHKELDTTEQLTLLLSVRVGILGCFQAICNRTRPDLFFPFLCFVCTGS